MNSNKFKERIEKDIENININTSALAETKNDVKKITNYSSTIETSSIKKENEKNYSSINHQKNNSIHCDLNSSNDKKLIQLNFSDKKINLSHNKIKNREREVFNKNLIVYLFLGFSCTEKT